MPVDLQAQLDAAAAGAGVIGALVSVSFDGRRADGAFGLLDSRSEAKAEVSSPFRLGSITKTMTATVLRSLLEQGGRSLDEAVEVLLPDAVPPQLGPNPITWRHVLLHRSGIDGTFWQGVGDAPDAIATYARATASLPVVFPAGSSWGYSNSSYVLAGRAIELLAGCSYESAVHEHLVVPMGLQATTL